MCACVYLCVCVCVLCDIEEETKRDTGTEWVCVEGCDSYIKAGLPSYHTPYKPTMAPNKKQTKNLLLIN